MSFITCGVLFLAVVLSFIGTYQYIVPKITGGAVGFSTDDFIHKLALGFIFTVMLIVLGYYLAQLALMGAVLFAYGGGPLALVGIPGLVLLVFIATSLGCGLLTFVMGKSMPNTVRCTTFGAAMKAGLAPGLVSTLVGLAGLGVLLSSLHID